MGCSEYFLSIIVLLVPPTPHWVSATWKIHSSVHYWSFFFSMHSWILVISSCIVTLTLPSPISPPILLECNPMFNVRSFWVLMSVAYVSSFGQDNKPAGCLMTIISRQVRFMDLNKMQMCSRGFSLLTRNNTTM